MAKYILFDTETTGNEDSDKIIQIGAMVIDSRGKAKIYDELCGSKTPIKIEAMEVHNIVPELIKDKPPFTESNFYKDLSSLNTPDNYLIAHNLKFDLGMLINEGFENRMQLIDTLRCAKHLYPDSPYHRLQYFRYALGLYKKEEDEAKKYNISIKAHNAIGDVLIMKLFLSKLVEKIRAEYPNINPMKKLVELTKQPVMLKIFRFGKYNGENIEEIARKDMGYIRWMYNNMELDEDMQFTLEHIMERYN